MVIFAVAILSSLLSSLLLWLNTDHMDSESSTHFITSLATVAITLLIELLLAIPIVLYVGIRQSHRIVGPMNRLKHTLEAIGKGEFSQRITLRQGDVLEDLAKSINRMAESLQQRFPRTPSA